jgi:hypothetical protein
MVSFKLNIHFQFKTLFMENAPQFNDILLYTTSDGNVKIEVLFEGETFWLSQKKMAELFGVQRPAITKHLKNIFDSGELQEVAVGSKMELTATKLHMGLTNWKQSPEGKILKSDVTIAKNYLSEQHILKLNRIVSAYLDLAESRAESGIIMNMEDWVKFLNQFLELSNSPILQNKGTVSAMEAKIKAEVEYEKYKVVQDQLFESDFDKEIKKMLNKPK